ncbi:MAG: 6-phosphofructokinase, partial [Planctomycetota bacterium]
MSLQRVGILTAGGLAPCLSSALGGLIEAYSRKAPDVEIICYRSGYKGLLLGDSFAVTASIREHASVLHSHGGSPIGNSRVKLTNVADCVARGLVSEGDDPLEIAAQQLRSDRVDVLHTIGGDDTNTTARDLLQYMQRHIAVVGLPKTIDNDITPVGLSLGAQSAAQAGAVYWRNVANEACADT